MSKVKWAGVLAAAALALTTRAVYAAETLTILWAEWDPANYLQELVKDYEKVSGVKVKVETVPWPDFQTKAFTRVRRSRATRTTWWSAIRNGWARARPAATTSI